MPGWQRELQLGFFLRQLHRPVVYWVLHWHFVYPCLPLALVVAVLTDKQTSGTSSDFISGFSIAARSEATNFGPRIPSRHLTVCSPSCSLRTTTNRFLGSVGPRSTSGTLSVAHWPMDNDFSRCLPRLVIRAAALDCPWSSFQLPPSGFLLEYV